MGLQAVDLQATVTPRRIRLYKTPFLFPVFLYLGLAALGAEQSLDDITALEEAGSYREAAAQYRVWLKDHGDSPDLFVALIRYSDVETDPRVAMSLMKELLTALTEEQRPEIARRIALLAELTGDIDAAAEFYALAAEGLSTTLQLNRASILIEEGLFSEAETLLSGLLSGAEDPEAMARTLALLGDLRVIEQRFDEAEEYFRRALETVTEMQTSSSSATPLSATLLSATPLPRILLGLYETYIGMGAPQRAQEVLDRMKTEHALAPEYLLAARSDAVVYAPTPVKTILVSVVGETVLLPSQNQVQAGQHRGATLIQMGSFSVLDNAQHMVAELEQAGFQARIREADVRGGLFYRVVLSEAVAEEHVQRTLIQLKEKGFEGFRLSE